MNAPISATAAAPAPQGLPALFERAAAANNFYVEGLSKLFALKRALDADAERRGFNEDFAALRAEIGRMAANAYDPPKRCSYADLNAIAHVIGPAVAAKGFALTFDTAHGSVDGTVKVPLKLMRNGVERTASVDMPMDGAGMRGGANMSAPQAYDSTVTYGRKLALSLLCNLTTVSGRQRAAEPPPRCEQPDLLEDDLGGAGLLRRSDARPSYPTGRRATSSSTISPSLMGRRGESASAVLEDDGSLSSRAAGAAIADRVGGRS